MRRRAGRGLFEREGVRYLAVGEEGAARWWRMKSMSSVGRVSSVGV